MEIKNQGKGIKLGGNKVIVRQNSLGQFTITIPRNLAELILLQDRDIVSFKLNSRDSLVLIKEKLTLEEYKKLKEEKANISNRLKQYNT